jgi:signal transduction histidine kinase
MAQRVADDLRQSSGGTGLGLAIALGIIERRLGGAIEIADAPRGLRICVPSE